MFQSYKKWQKSEIESSWHGIRQEQASFVWWLHFYMQITCQWIDVTTLGRQVGAQRAGVLLTILIRPFSAYQQVQIACRVHSALRLMTCLWLPTPSINRNAHNFYLHSNRNFSSYSDLSASVNGLGWIWNLRKPMKSNVQLFFLNCNLSSKSGSK